MCPHENVLLCKCAHGDMRAVYECGCGCGGKKQRYHLSKPKLLGTGGRKIFTYCPTTNRSTTPGFDNQQFESLEHFKRVVDEELERLRNASQN